jgi:hypothetical protein
MALLHTSCAGDVNSDFQDIHRVNGVEEGPALAEELSTHHVT